MYPSGAFFPPNRANMFCLAPKEYLGRMKWQQFDELKIILKIILKRGWKESVWNGKVGSPEQDKDQQEGATRRSNKNRWYM